MRYYNNEYGERDDLLTWQILSLVLIMLLCAVLSITPFGKGTQSRGGAPALITITKNHSLSTTIPLSDPVKFEIDRQTQDFLKNYKTKHPLVGGIEVATFNFKTNTLDLVFATSGEGKTSSRLITEDASSNDRAFKVLSGAVDCRQVSQQKNSIGTAMSCAILVTDSDMPNVESMNRFNALLTIYFSKFYYDGSTELDGIIKDVRRLASITRNGVV